ncbi:MAG: DUF3568 family protein [Candidatus Omnitrophica bacterium]|nr:DUF3568 family protein [Candidatus Omnitrophota bacterium]
MNDLLKAWAVAVFLVLNSGCAAMLIGAGVAGGLVISEDAAKFNVDKDFNHAWAASHQALFQEGKITFEDKTAGKMEAAVGDSRVVVLVKAITRRSTSVEVKARKNLLPHLALSTDISHKIQEGL